MAFLGNLVAEVRAGTSKLVGDEQVAKQLYTRIERHGKQAMLSVAGATVTLSGAMAVMTMRATENVNELRSLANVAGLNTTKFQEMVAASRRFGVSQEKISDILKDVNDKLGDFINTGGGPMLDFFEQIAPRVGVTVDQFKKLNSADALQLYVSSLEKANVSQSEMTFYMEAIANDATLLLPLLRDNGTELARIADEAHAFGAILDNEMIAALGDAREALDEVQLGAEGLRNKLVAEMAPALERMARRLTDVARAGGPVEEGLDELSKTFGEFLDVITSEDAISVGVAALNGIAVIAKSAADFVLLLSDNVGILTAGLSTLAIGLAALGGPLTLVVGALGGALLGIASLRDESDDLALSANLTAVAEEQLKEALDNLAVSGEKAVKVGSQLIGSHITEAKAAVAAAEAELALASARLENGPSDAEGRRRRRNFEQDAAAAEAATARLKNAQEQLLGLQRMLEGFKRSSFPTQGTGANIPDTQTDSTPGSNNDIKSRLDEIRDSLMSEREVIEREYENRRAVIQEALDKGVIDRQESQALIEKLEEEHQQRMSELLNNGGGSGGGIMGRLERLQESFASERELLEQNYEVQSDLLKEALASDLITRDEYHELAKQAEEQFQRDMASIRGQERKEALDVASGMFTNLASLTRSGNKRLFEIGKAAAMANALLKGREAVLDSYAAGARIGGPPVGAAFAATAAVATAAQISDIASSSFGGGGSTGSSSSASSSVASSAGSSTEAAQRSDVSITLEGEGYYSPKQVRALVAALNEALEDGATIGSIKIS